MLLTELLRDFVKINNIPALNVSELSLDSRHLNKNSIFFAYPGTNMDGRNFIEAAIKQGASAIVYENGDGFRCDINTIPVIGIADLRKKISWIAAKFYHTPSEKLKMIGVTGTNGKTSCCHYIAQALQKLNYHTAVMGTLGNGITGQVKPSNLTTENAIEIQKILADFVAQNIDIVAMEASSHGLEQARLDAVNFEIAVFTNLTRDHLDYHKTLQDYAEAKAKLFAYPQLKAAIINLDDEFGRELATRICGKKLVYGYSSVETPPQIDIPILHAQHLHLDMNGIHATLKTPWGDGVLHSNLIGRFNVANLLAIIGVLGSLNIPISKILEIVNHFELISGRIQVLGGGTKPHVVIDYAHTPDALEKVLLTLKELRQDGKIWCVFGCGGNRDRGKRSLMGEIAERLADQVVITNDNPRHESPQDIATDIIEKIRNPRAVIIEFDRKRAISHAIQCASANDIVLIAGKGHERYQQIGDEKIPFSDTLTAQMLLEAL